MECNASQRQCSSMELQTSPDSLWGDDNDLSTPMETCIHRNKPSLSMKASPSHHRDAKTPSGLSIAGETVVGLL